MSRYTSSRPRFDLRSLKNLVREADIRCCIYSREELERRALNLGIAQIAIDDAEDWAAVARLITAASKPKLEFVTKLKRGFDPCKTPGCKLQTRWGFCHKCKRRPRVKRNTLFALADIPKKALKQEDVHIAAFYDPPPSGNKYHRTIKDLEAKQAITVDVYCVLQAFNVVNPGLQHAIKKLLCAGIRGKGDVQQDLDEAIDAIKRAKQLV